MTEWRQVHKTAYVETHRDGWRGVMDALTSAILGRDRLIVVRPVTFSVWVRVGDEHVVSVLPRVEVGVNQQ